MDVSFSTIGATSGKWYAESTVLDKMDCKYVEF